MQNTPWREKILLYRLYDRDADAFGELYDVYAPRIYRYIYFKVSSSVEAEDLTADVFLKTWEYVQKREDKITSFRPFVYRLARNVVIDHYRSRAKDSVTASAELMARVMEPVEQSFAVNLSFRSDLETVTKGLAAIKDEYREVILLRYIEDYSIAEVAKILEKSRGAIRVTTHRALDALREAVTNIESSTTQQ
ncbi:hypothetical protein COV04_02900 [Candidatus Uhrbacteria bacterium CG10_big_fil_rev_8_21_14_0_10_48_11]|uniref:RNA polymerase sigma factor n=1 Tax=Candidatus Uhrbacteria bacterium CG10_big_fil_rev_8_21_14_0_10_48_11 TaxID=1975037 RepID=A0A2M8LEI8_9BACT|nr:MAG: hypothetical protein COV04_02900 [Candidatus Uhrbacteria bacterium CG10_big_fil_rev_8_21_14_0_10_48_11]